ncbi:MAG: PAS domain S-box protein [Fibrobacter sp.]|jgi:PAS domain S-box-containing protein|nr:PAS domain S-box protein [Fibrobacter sp.]
MKKIRSEKENRQQSTISASFFETSSIAKAALSSSISPIAFVDCEKEHLVYANSAFLSIWGYTSSDEVIGKSASIFWQTKRMDRQVRRKIYDKGGWIGELLAYRKDGRVFPTQVSTTMLVDADSMPLLQMFSFVDISERVSAQNEQRRLLHNLQERVKELNCLYKILSFPHNKEMTLEGVLQHIVNALTSSLRWPECSYARIVIGEFDVYTPNFTKSSSLFSTELKIGEETGILEVGYYHNDAIKEEMALLCEEQELLKVASKEIERLIEQKRDEAELRRNREQLLHADKLLSIGVLSSEIMHEIGNPNNFIAINTKMLSRIWKDVLPVLDMYYKENGDFSVAGLPFTEARQEVVRLLDGIAEGSERIHKISSNLRSFIAKGRSISDEIFKVNDAVTKAIAFSRNFIDSCTENFCVLLSQQDLFIKGDSNQIQQVVINLITNACQALTSSKEMVRITTSLDQDNQLVKITVEDEGTGIHQHDIPHLMDPFFTTKKDKFSTGLGLSISNDIAIKHGGKILIHSVLNKGTRVEFILPCENAKDCGE